MALPPSASTTVIRGCFQDTAGGPLSVDITFIPEPARVVARTDKVTLYNAKITTSTDPATGNWQLEVLSSDDQDLDPYDWTYTVVLSGDVKDTLTGIPAPLDAPIVSGKPTIDLTELIGGSASEGLGKVYVLAALTDVDLSTPPFDGQYLVYDGGRAVWTGGGAAAIPTWTTILDKPATFPPSAHTHTAAEASALPDTYLPDWADLTSVPATFTPATHTHTAAEAGALPSTYVPAWSALTGVPATFTPATHTHTPANVTGLATVATSGAYADLSGKPTLASLSGVAKDAQVVDVRDHGAVGNGTTDDSAAIAASITAATAGATVLFPPGTYAIATGITVTKRVRLTGGGATLLAAANGLDGWLTFAAGSEGSAVEGLRFDSANRARGIITSGVDDFTISNCWFTGYTSANGSGATDSAIKLNAGSRGKVLGCTISDWGYGDAALHRAITLNSAAVHDCVIADNIVRRASQGCVVVGSGHAITGNTFDDLTDNPIYVIGTGDGTAGSLMASDLTIAGNTFIKGEECIVLSGAAEASTAWLENITITGNNFRDWTNKCVALEYRIRGVSVTGNTFRSDAGGSYVTFRTASAGALTQDVVISDNAMVGQAGFAPIYLQNIVGLVIADNRMKFTHTTTGNYVIRLDGTAQNQVAVTGNIIEATANTPNAWRFNGTLTACHVAGNLLTGCGGELPAGLAISNQGWDSATTRVTSPTGRQVRVTAIPTTGSWAVGDIAWNLAPAAGGTIGWVCVAGGIPGTWRTFGTIAP